MLAGTFAPSPLCATHSTMLWLAVSRPERDRGTRPRSDSSRRRPLFPSTRGASWLVETLARGGEGLHERGRLCASVRRGVASNDADNEAWTLTWPQKQAKTLDWRGRLRGPLHGGVASNIMCEAADPYRSEGRFFNYVFILGGQGPISMDSQRAFEPDPPIQMSRCQIWTQNLHFLYFWLPMVSSAILPPAGRFSEKWRLFL